MSETCVYVRQEKLAPSGKVYFVCTLHKTWIPLWDGPVPEGACERMRASIAKTKVLVKTHVASPKRLRVPLPDLTPAAKKLGVPVESVGRYAPRLAAWQAAGMPELPPEELAARDAVCVQCDFKRPLGWGWHDDRDTCNSTASGCGGDAHRPPLVVMQRLPDCKCPEKKW
jgi:hypothetical protein